MFYDRADAAEKLTKLLQNYKNLPDSLVLAIPRGGVVLGGIIAKNLQLPLDIIISKKIPAPDNSEFAIGAVAEKGDPVLDDELIGTMGITADYLDQKITDIRSEIKRRVQLYRGNKPHLSLKNKTIILVDDGIATGFSTIATLDYLRSLEPKKIIIAVAVIPQDLLEQLKSRVDELVALEIPQQFFAVGQFYEHFEQISDNEVIKILKESIR